MKYGELDQDPEDKPEIPQVDEAGTSHHPFPEEELKISKGAKDWEGMGLKEGRGSAATDSRLTFKGSPSHSSRKKTKNRKAEAARHYVSWSVLCRRLWWSKRT
eukprot:TRINITY_DN8035_c0_g1_i1.p4 TRINITY_DN8035_c0_g1~~TRINITY_DN8035_c0_g1_i1.p4  ORF type:complete len:103 (-),score=1.52 TRINITY_DN8035_c0_g1_i1:1194-1502(-)